MAKNIQGFGIQLETGGFSLEAYTVFSTYNEASTYAKKDSAYAGKLISVTDDPDTTKNGAYIIEGSGLNASLKKIGSDLSDQLTSIYTYKGSKPTYADLPPTGNEVGDVWNVEAAYTVGGKTYAEGTNWAWNGESWNALTGGSIDLSGYATSEEVSAIEDNVNKHAATLEDLDTRLKSAESEIDNTVTIDTLNELIPSSKLALIDTNKNDIDELRSRMGTVEKNLTWRTI